MDNLEKKKRYTKLCDDRNRIIKYLKERTEKGYHERLMKRLEKINKEIEEFIK